MATESKSMSFVGHLGQGNANAIIQNRIFELAQEGYQHELNVGYLESRLGQDLSDEERESVAEQLSQARKRISELNGVIVWHEKQLVDIDSD